MIKKLQIKFFAVVATIAFFILGIFYSALNILMINNTNQTIQNTLTIINEKSDYLSSGNIDFFTKEENKLEFHFFFVEIQDREESGFYAYDVSIDENNAKKYALKHLNDKSTFGRDKNYYFMKKNLENNTTRFIFLDCKDRFLSQRKLTTISGIIALILWLLISICSTIFSRYAIKPYLIQYENEKQFITNASHELKTPLAIIQANIEVLSMENTDNEWIKSTLKQTSRMTKLVNNLVLLTKLNENNINVLCKEDFNISEILNDAAETYKVLTIKKNIDYTYKIEDDIIYNGDIEVLSKLFSILLDNAIKYTPENGSISISLENKKKYVHIKIFNTCQDLKKENIDKLFDRFYREEKSRSRKTGGYGIGLSLAKSIVEAHSSTIKATYKENGVEFSIKLKYFK